MNYSDIDAVNASQQARLDKGKMMLTKIKLLAATGALAAAVSAISTAAAPVILNVSGVAGSAGAYTGLLNLDVTNGAVTGATGTLSIAGLTNAQLGLVTTSTPGNENNDPNYPVGFRANDGTDIFGTDQKYPLDVGGLLFAVGTTTPTFGQNPLINFYNDNGTNTVLFTGNVNGTEYYAQTGSLNITVAPVAAVPEPAMWLTMILGFGVVGAALRRRQQKVTTRVVFA